MSITRRGLSAAALALAAAPAWAADPYPNGPVRVIIPFSPGGSADVFGRMIAEHLTKVLGKPFVCENVGGAGSTLGIGQAARAAPDGQTIGLGSISGLSIIPAFGNVPITYKVDDLVLLGQITAIPNVLAVNPDKIRARSVPDLIAYMKANPGKVTYGTPGVGTSQHLAAELFQAMTGTSMEHAPYRGSGQMVVDLLSGAIDLSFDNIPLLIPYVADRKLVLLGSATRERPAFDRNLPAIAEYLPGFEAVAWHGFFLPKGTSPEIANRLSQVIIAFMRQPFTIARFEELGATAVSTTPAEFSAFVKEENARWGKLIADRHIQPS
ncbi:tripartite tricarboxylate transporter substrate binding protein (plasmid) [Roseomonas sp. OT10]|uniref:Bug family tripartite tricarboxylate transporter substrate binding protein n=1 Tax=Roseomonas cutis TaxID=2897332 RepID=UPI001E522A9A|nr:tripartite tricarboxylate transporter substrate binding protein [Roseomonas sp. OT10]UFN51658.1 tripartite tricarboxylate transporter substrate binding protein [Roseomonas sp. OT10]